MHVDILRKKKLEWKLYVLLNNWWLDYKELIHLRKLFNVRDICWCFVDNDWDYIYSGLWYAIWSAKHIRNDLYHLRHFLHLLFSSHDIFVYVCLFSTLSLKRLNQLSLIFLHDQYENYVKVTEQSIECLVISFDYFCEYKQLMC